MHGNYTHYLLCQSSALSSRISTRYDWQTHTYRDEERTGTRDVQSTVSLDNTKSEITAYMDEHSIDYNSGDTKQDLIDKVSYWWAENGVPTVSESYTYTESVIDTTTDHEATLSDMIDRKPTYFAKRESPDGDEFVVKFDGTMAELNALPSGIQALTNEEVKSYIDENWDESD